LATQYPAQIEPAGAAVTSGSLGDAERTILGPRRDALLFWGAPLCAFLFVEAWLAGWTRLAPAGLAESASLGLVWFVGVLTWAHLIAVAPRAYLNAQVFAAYRLRLTIVPIVLLAALLLSSTALVFATVLAVFWDVHHSAMQNFGFARIYDMKAGTPPQLLRSADLRLNWMLYAGPLLAGASLAAHTDYLRQFDGTVFASLTQVPGLLEADHGGLRLAAIGLYAAVIGWTAFDYAQAIRGGYRIPVHKLATIVSTGAVSILAWGFSPPLVALAAINLYHAVQYFALVWVKEGAGMSRRLSAGGERRRVTQLLFLAGCALFGLGYAAAVKGETSLLLAPFIACSLLHFWYDSFVWSVRKREV
jgi:hypothetical protein